jgi:hypothetical protein
MNFSHKKLPDLSISYLFLSFLLKRRGERRRDYKNAGEEGEFSRSG